MKITREMISAAHDITMRHKIVLGHDLLSKIYQAMKSASPESKPLTDEMIWTAARVLNDRQAESCGVHKDDQWIVYSEEFWEDAKAMLEAAHGIKE